MPPPALLVAIVVAGVVLPLQVVGIPAEEPAAGASPLPGTLEPAAAWRHFRELCGVPRCVNGGVRSYVQGVVESLGYEAIADEVGNILVHRQGSARGGVGGSAPTPVVLHTRLGSACKEGADVTASSGGPAEPRLSDDGWAVADEWSLGADSGMGIALALALLEEPPETPLPPLEVLFTAQGAVGSASGGALGARGSALGLLSGTQLINLDAEEHGTVVVGSAGSQRVKLHLPVATVPMPSQSRPLVIVARGFTGGHSGLDAGASRGNSIVALARALDALRSAVREVKVVGISGGGGGDDRIPVKARAEVAVPLHEIAAARDVLAAVEADLRDELGDTDPGLQLRVEQPDNVSGTAISDEGVQRLLDLLLLTPSGVIRGRSPEHISGSVQTSVSVARVRESAPGMLEVLCVARSTLPGAMRAVRGRIDRLAQRLVASSTWGPPRPAWSPRRSSELLGAVREAFLRVEGRTPSVAVMHSDLEVAEVASKMADPDVVSLGPDVPAAGVDRRAGECVRVDSMPRTWALLRVLLGALARAGPGGPDFGAVDL